MAARALPTVFLLASFPFVTFSVDFSTISSTSFPRASSAGIPEVLFSSDAEPLNKHPVIGVLSQPGDGLDACHGPCRDPSDPNNPASAEGASRESWSQPLHTSYIAASYVKLAEAGGARVVPVIYNRPWSDILKTLRSINGLLLPGGYANKTGLFLKRIKQLLSAAIDFNKAGDYFPVLAECLSFEMLAMVISKEGRNVLERFDATHPSTLHLAGEWVKQRNMFQWMPPALIELVQTQNITMQNHRFGVSPGRLLADPDLSSFFNILTTTFDEAGKEYVSTVEAKEIPLTATQWHPEKNAFEWGNALYPHTTQGVQVTSAAAIFFVNEARKSTHKFVPRSLLTQSLIYNFSPTFSGQQGPGHYTQAYIFPCRNASGSICYA